MSDTDALDSVDDLHVPDNIDDMLRKAAKETLTRDEIRAQKISFALGMMPDSSTMTRRDIEELIDSRYG